MTPAGALQILAHDLIKGKEIKLVEELFSPDFFNRDPLFDYPSDRQGLKKLLEDLFFAFPDLRADIIHLMGEGNKGTIVFNLKGTHKGSFVGLNPTDQEIQVRVAFLARFNCYKIVEAECLLDKLDIMNQVEKVNFLKYN